MEDLPDKVARIYLRIRDIVDALGDDAPKNVESAVADWVFDMLSELPEAYQGAIVNHLYQRAGCTVWNTTAPYRPDNEISPN